MKSAQAVPTARCPLTCSVFRKVFIMPWYIITQQGHNLVMQVYYHFCIFLINISMNEIKWSPPSLQHLVRHRALTSLQQSVIAPTW